MQEDSTLHTSSHSKDYFCWKLVRRSHRVIKTEFIHQSYSNCCLHAEVLQSPEEESQSIAHVYHEGESSEPLKILLRQQQQNFFEEEIRKLEINVQVKKTSRLVKLYPFLHEGVLCVAGRLVHVTLEDEAKYPGINPAESHHQKFSQNHPSWGH